MIRPILLDTCAALWTASPPGWSPVGEAAIAEADASGVAVFVSPITAWEIGLLVERGRVDLGMHPRVWFNKLLDRGIELARLTPDVLIASTDLPGSLHRDPADRILAATAREYRYRLMTRDRPLLAYAGAGYLQAIAC